MTNPITMFLKGKGHIPPDVELMNRHSDAKDTLEAARRTYSAASLQAASGSIESKHALETARKALSDSEAAERETTLALEEARALSEKRKADAAAADVRRRWKISREHAEARLAAAQNIEKYIAWLTKSLADFDKANKALGMSCPISLQGSMHSAAGMNSSFNNVRGQIELHLAKEKVLSDGKYQLALRDLLSLTDYVESANARLYELDNSKCS
jgi:hypothetical protein